MNKRQAGVSLIGLIVVLVILAVVALLGMKVVPSYMEFRGMKNVIQTIARERPNASPAEVRRAYESRQIIDGFESVKPQDLVVEKGAISFAYRKEVPLFTGVALCIDYAASTGQ
jgi:hypothetical protein